MSTTEDNDNNRKHPRGDEGEEEVNHLLHDQEEEQESSQKRTKVDDNTMSASSPWTSKEEGEVTVGLVGGDGVEIAANSAPTVEVHHTSTTTEAPQQSVMLTTAPVAHNASLPEQEVPSYDPAFVNEKFLEEFAVGTWFESYDELRTRLNAFGNKFCFIMRKQTDRNLKCSKSSNTNYRKKESKEKEMTTTPFAAASGCPVEVRHTLKASDGNRVQITKVIGLHNHPLDVPHVAVSQRLSGRNIEKVLPLLAPSFAPLMKNNSAVDIETARKILRAHLGDDVSMKVESIHTILRAVKKYINSGKYTPTGTVFQVQQS